MYLSYYGLRELPFELTANPRFLFLAPPHREALSNLQYGLASAKPVTLLIGEAGTGKTTLLRSALESERGGNIRCLYLHNPALTRDEFLEALAHQMDLGEDAVRSKTALIIALDRKLRERRAVGQIVALVVDEAQSLSNELLEEIRLLSNIESDTEKLLPLVLAGQPELAGRLNQSELRQLKQRVALRCELRPFTLPETAAYMAARIRAAGGDASRLFTREAVFLIHEHAHGIPRTISVICDNALVTGMALGRRPVDRAMVAEVCADFDLTVRSRGEAPTNHTDGEQTEIVPDLPLVSASTDLETALQPVAPQAAAAPGRRYSFLGLSR
jgi:type II secretory pathway predicted ATPase ExeA